MGWFDSGTSDRAVIFPRKEHADLGAVGSGVGVKLPKVGGGVSMSSSGVSWSPADCLPCDGLFS